MPYINLSLISLHGETLCLGLSNNVLQLPPLKEVVIGRGQRDFSFLLAPPGCVCVHARLQLSTKSIVFVNITNFVKGRTSKFIIRGPLLYIFIIQLSYFDVRCLTTCLL